MFYSYKIFYPLIRLIIRALYKRLIVYIPCTTSFYLLNTHCTLQFNGVQYTTVHYSTVRYSTLQYSNSPAKLPAIFYPVILYCDSDSDLYCTVLYFIVLYYTFKGRRKYRRVLVQYSTVQYSTVSGGPADK